MFHLVFKPGAYEMLNEAYYWYEQQLPGLGERLLTEFETAFDKLKHNPTYYSYVNDSYRQLILRHFPYKIIYEVTGRNVIIYAVFHTHQDSERMFE